MDSDSTAVADAAPAPPRASVPRRVLGGLAGLVLLGVAAVVLYGVPLVAALIGLAIAVGIQRRRRRAYTGLTGWLGATLGVAIAFAAFMTFALVRAPSGSLEQARKEAMTRQEQHPQQIPAWIRRYMPQTQPPRQLTEATNRITYSRPFFWWIMAMTVVLGGLMVGAFEGTLAWGGASLLLYGARGRWPSARRAPPASGDG